MRGLTLTFLSIIYVVLVAQTASAAVEVRWTGKEDTTADFAAVVSKINEKTGETFVADDFKLLESQRLATSQFDTYAQVAGGVPLGNRNLRIWKDPFTGLAIQVEAYLE